MSVSGSEWSLIDDDDCSEISFEQLCIDHTKQTFASVVKLNNNNSTQIKPYSIPPYFQKKKKTVYEKQMNTIPTVCENEILDEQIVRKAHFEQKSVHNINGNTMYRMCRCTGCMEEVKPAMIRRNFDGTAFRDKKHCYKTTFDCSVLGNANEFLHPSTRVSLNKKKQWASLPNQLKENAKSCSSGLNQLHLQTKKVKKDDILTLEVPIIGYVVPKGKFEYKNPDIVYTVANYIPQPDTNVNHVNWFSFLKKSFVKHRYVSKEDALKHRLVTKDDCNENNETLFKKELRGKLSSGIKTLTPKTVLSRAWCRNQGLDACWAIDLKTLYNGRDFNELGKHRKKNYYLDIDLMANCNVSHISTMARPPATLQFPRDSHLNNQERREYKGPLWCIRDERPKKRSYFVTSYTVEYRIENGREWIQLGTFKGNVNDHEEVIHAVGLNPVYCRYLRIRPSSNSWLTNYNKFKSKYGSNASVAMQVAVFGEYASTKATVQRAKSIRFDDYIPESEQIHLVNLDNPTPKYVTRNMRSDRYTKYENKRERKAKRMNRKKTAKFYYKDM